MDKQDQPEKPAAPRKTGEAPADQRLELPADTFDSLVRELSESLTGEPLADADRERIVKARLSPRYEIRIQTTSDPIAEETRIYRSMADEADDRYDEYMRRVDRNKDKHK